MNQEDKELLLKDLSARLLYGVKCQYTCVVQEGTLVTGKSNWIGELKGIVPQRNGHIGFIVDCDKVDALEGDIKPVLRPMSSMTEEEKVEYYNTMDKETQRNYPNSCDFSESVYYSNTIKTFDWLIAHHFDYRGLIEKGLAIEVNESNNPYKKDE